MSQENRQPFFGHMLLLGPPRPVMPWCTDGPPEADLAAWQETTMSDWADRCHEQDGTVVIPHFPLPNGEPATLIATDRADAIEMIVPVAGFHAEYYGYLNAGYRLPLVGGTDKMSLGGARRACIGRTRKFDDEGFGYEAWCRAVRAAADVPHAAVRSCGSRSTVTRPATPSSSAGRRYRQGRRAAESIFPVGSLELVLNGEVIAASDEPSGGVARLELRERRPDRRRLWLAVRSGGPGYFDGPLHRGPWERRIFAHTSPVYVTCGDGEWSRTDPCMGAVHARPDRGGHRAPSVWPRYPEDRITHHHGEVDHGAFLERPFVEALDRVRARLDRRRGLTVFGG